jgi:glycosyltransferase involved in cell wall biosynthesis
MKQDKVDLWWVSGFKDTAIGNAYGYRIHNDNLRREVEKIADIKAESKNSFGIMSPEYYVEKWPGINFLFTMFEGTTIPDVYADSIKKTDYLIAPSKWVKDLFDLNFPDIKSFVVSHGVDRIFSFKRRKRPNTKKFRYLWVGAPNPRKGWEEIINAWNLYFKDNKDVELYIKTTRMDGLRTNGNVIVDGRNISTKELVDIYHSAHCFVFPTRGEGFGLTLAEAMRTGLPCIATNYSGVTDFFDATVGYPVGYKMGEGKVTFIKDQREISTEIAYPFVDELIYNMIKVHTDYNSAVRKGERASQRISAIYNWGTSAHKLVEIIREYGIC